MLIKISQSWEDILIGYDADNCHHPNACDPLPCCAETGTEVSCCPYKDGVCCDEMHCCPPNTVCASGGCKGINVRIKHTFLMNFNIYLEDSVDLRV